MTPLEYARARHLKRVVSFHFIICELLRSNPLHKLHTAGSYLLSVFFICR